MPHDVPKTSKHSLRTFVSYTISIRKRVAVITGCSRVQHSPHFWFREKPDRLSQTLSPTSFESRSERCQARHVALAYPTTARNPHTTITPPTLATPPPSSLHLLLTTPPPNTQTVLPPTDTPACPPHPQPGKKSSGFSSCHVLFVYSHFVAVEKRQKPDEDEVAEEEARTEYSDSAVLSYYGVPEQKKVFQLVGGERRIISVTVLV